MKAQQKGNTKHQQNLIKHDTNESTRLNKYISDSGFCSRREADSFIENGHVTIDGAKAVLGAKVVPGQIVSVDGKIVEPKSSRVYIMLNKPIGITCTNDLEIKNNIRSFVDYKELIFPIGRLDKDSTGLILLTNDGDIVNKILRAEYGHEKEYIVTLSQDITKDFISKMRSGVIIYNQVAHKDQKTNPCDIEMIDNKTFRIILTQGLNKQIRRMCEALGYYVDTLKRIRIMNIELGDLKLGEWRYLSDIELSNLNKLINR